MRRHITRARFVATYYLSWAVFGAVGLLLNLGCMVLMLLPSRDSLGPGVRATIRRLFEAWLAWFHATQIIRIEWKGFDEGPLQPGTVYIANHPTLIDATIILARLPDAVCIFKPSLMRNPAIGPAAVMAGYVRGDAGLDLIKAAAARVSAGQSLLVFPEGTRTGVGISVGPMKPGFALIADRAKAPVRLLVVRSSPGLCARGRPWWRAPRVLPGTIEISLDQSWPYEPGRSAAELTQSVETRICDVLGDARPG
ncbi:MAG TPA: lysophospholipid acyltransferase family protein [Opitutaceae bacterium]|nr:lysophospholipid acyltransferase family protein [Opitutaceae bacterium]